MNRRTALGFAAFTLLASWPSGRAATIGYDDMMVRLRSAVDTGKVKVVRIGYSVMGRAIPMVAIGRDDSSVRVLILCRQHGDEPVSTQAAMRVLAEAERGGLSTRSSLSHTQLLIVPMVNPDGAERFRRTNARSVDLNRDWIRRSQPETRAVAAVYERLAPQVVLDEHEWTVSDSCGYDALETGQAAGRVARKIQAAAVTTGVERGVPLIANRVASTLDPSLAHHYFQSRGAAAFLLETTPDIPFERRLVLYDKMMIRVAMASNAFVVKTPAPETIGGFAPMFPPHRTRIPAPAPQWPTLGLIALGGVALFLSALKGHPVVSQNFQPSLRGARRVPLGQVADLAARLHRRHVPLG